MAELESPPPTERSPRARQMELAVILGLLTAFLAVSVWRQRLFLAGVSYVEAIGVIIAAGLTLIMYSFLYRDNPLFKVAENLYVGVALGYTAIAVTWEQSLRPEVFEPFMTAPTSTAFWEVLIHRGMGVLLGLCLLTQLSRKRGWVSRYAFGSMVGWGAGVGIATSVNSFILKQLDAAVQPLQAGLPDALPRAFTGDWWAGVFFPIAGAVVLLVGTVCVLFYFFFSVRHRKVGAGVSKVGIWFLMISFGASFGYTVMGRLSLLIGRVQFLLFDWLNIPR